MLSINLKDALKVFNVFVINVFGYFKVYVFWKFIQYTLHWDKTQMLKKNFSDKINVTKNALFPFRELQLITLLLLTCNSYTSSSKRFISLKLCVRFSIFDSVSFLLLFIFFSTKSMGSLTLKRHNSFQNKNDRIVAHIFAPRPLTFKLQQRI